MTIAVVNTKGGAGKSTFALQIAASYFLYNKKAVELIEFDDENKDAESFPNSSIRTRQVKVGDGSAITDILRETLLKKQAENTVLDVGGNKTTTILIEGLKKSMLYKRIDLMIIPMSGGTQDLKNAEKTYDLVKDFDIPIMFGLRVRNIERLRYQYQDYFRYFPTNPYIFMSESGVIDLSRNEQKSIYEVAIDKEKVKLLEKDLMEAFDEDNYEKSNYLSWKRETYMEAQNYFVNILIPAWERIAAMLKFDAADTDVKEKCDA